VELGQVGLEYGDTGSAAGHEQVRPHTLQLISGTDGLGSCGGLHVLKNIHCHQADYPYHHFMCANGYPINTTCFIVL
jgi:hypothetical protein